MTEPETTELSEPQPVSLTPGDPSKIKPRLTIVETVSYQPPNRQASQVSSGFSRDLETYEQPYEREMVATEEWQPLINEQCWVKECSLVHVTNEEGRYLQVNPSEEEQEATAAKVLEISFGTANLLGHWEVRPGEAFRGTPSHPKALFIRCRSGEACFTLHVFPR